MRNQERLAKAAFTDFNKRAHIEDELFSFCRSKRVVVFDYPTDALGEYTIFEGRECIIIDPGLRGGERLWVFSHEVGHLLFHHPFSQKFCAAERQQDLFLDKLDSQANFFASLFLIPKKELQSKTLGEIAEEFGYPLELIQMRQYFYDLYKK